MTLSVLSFPSNRDRWWKKKKKIFYNLTPKCTLKKPEKVNKSRNLRIMRYPVALVPFLILASNVLAESVKGTYEQIIIYSCQAALGSYKFGCGSSHWDCICNYEPLLGSMSQCIHHYLPNYQGSIEKAYERFGESCLKNANVVLSKERIEDSFKNSSSVIRSPGDVGLGTLYVPILPYENDIAPKVRDYRAFLGNIDLSQKLGVVINVFFLVTLVWFGICNKVKQSKRINSKLKNHTIDLIRSRISLPLLWNQHMEPFHYFKGLTALLPTNAESVVLLIYFSLNTLFLFSGYSIYPENQLMGSDLMAQGARYLADRSGILSFAHFPLLVLFAGRNNILISLSGLPYASFMVFHRWTARVMFIDAAIHSVAYMVIILYEGRLQLYLPEVWFYTGITAFLVGLFIVGLAIHNIRVRWYEFFLISHVILAVWFFAMCYTHCLTFGWLEWVGGALALWALDRVIRVYRLIKFGAPVARIKFVTDETFKVRVKRPHNWKPYPGCFVFIHFLHPSIFWQSHPFTIIDSVLEDEEVIIYIKAKEGLTAKVLEILGSRVGNEAKMRVSLEGPYGNQSAVDSFDNVVLISGGNGIPGPFYHALHLIHTPLIPKQRVRLIWVIRSVDSLKWFEKELELLEGTPIECDIYITRDFKTQEDTESELVHRMSKFINFYPGRASTDKILLDEFTNCRGSVGIVTCGPPVMCDNVRDFVANNLGLCPYRVDLFEELQVW